ncbi:MAG: universal stress protein [Solirubrobacteraceae bacterium]
MIGIDGRPGGNDAIALAKLLAAPHAQLTLAQVYGAGLMPGKGAAMLLEREREQSQRLLGRVRSAAALDAQLVSIANRSVARGLQQLAARTPADLIVVGRGHHGLLGRALDSDDASDSLGGAPCAVAIAPSGYAGRAATPVRLGVGYDGSAEGDRAIALMREVAASSAGSTMRALVAAGHAPADGAGIELETVHGDPAQALEQFSERLDLLIIGSRAGGPIGRLSRNGAAAHLARYARCPLIVASR